MFFLQVIVLKISFSFTQVLMKELSRIVIHVGKIISCASQLCHQCPSQLFRRNFGHSCDQVTFRISLSEKWSWQWRRTLPSKYHSWKLVLNKKLKLNTWNTISFSYHLKVISTQNTRIQFFSCISHRVWYDMSMFR